MSDYLLLGGIALGVLSLIIAVIQLLQTRPPRAAAITLVLAILALLAGAWLAPQPLQLSYICDAWTRISGGEVEAPAPAAEAPTPTVTAPGAASDASPEAATDPAQTGETTP